MTATTTPNRQKPGQRVGGQYSERERAEAEVSLLGQGYPTINTPTQDQRRRAKEASARSAAWAGASGADIHRGVDDYARDLADQEAAYEAFKLGSTHPDDAAFDAIWEGDAPGLSRTTTEQHLKSAEAERLLIDEGEIPALLAADVDGSETPHELAAALVDERIDMYTEALASSGKSLSINQAAVARARKAAERAEAPF